MALDSSARRAERTRRVLATTTLVLSLPSAVALVLITWTFPPWSPPGLDVIAALTPLLVLFTLAALAITKWVYRDAVALKVPALMVVGAFPALIVCMYAAGVVIRFLT